MLLVDGHNLIGKLPNISLSDPDDEAKLVRVLENYHAVRPHDEILVVFDPASHGGGWRGTPSRNEGVAVRFAPRGVSAARSRRQGAAGRRVHRPASVRDAAESSSAGGSEAGKTREAG